MKREKDPWAPFGLAITFVAGVVWILTALGAVGTVLAAFGHTGSVFGTDDVCVDIPPGVLSGGNGATGEVALSGIKPGVSQSADLVQACDLKASNGQHVLASIDGVLDLVFLSGFLVMALLLIGAGRRRGTFTPEVARWVTRIGAYVIAGALVVAMAHALLRSRLIATMTTTGDGAAVFMMFDVSVAALIAGFGCLTAGRVMARSVVLQREVETLV